MTNKAESVLAFLGKGVKDVFAWITSPKGIQVIQTAEGVAESVYPPATAIINIANVGLEEIIKIEALAAAAGVQSGSGVQKAAAVTSVLTPQILSFAKQYGFDAPTAVNIQSASDALVAFLNALAAK